MHIRLATDKDANAVAHILISSRLTHLPYAQSPHTDESVHRWVRNKLIPTSAVIIAQQDDVDVGVLATSQSEGVSWIDQLYIAPGYTGRGIGTELISYAMGSLAKPIRLWTFQQSHRDRRFYEHHGFQAIKQTDGQDNEEKCPDVLYELA